MSSDEESVDTETSFEEVSSVGSTGSSTSTHEVFADDIITTKPGKGKARQIEYSSEDDSDEGQPTFADISQRIGAENVQIDSDSQEMTDDEDSQYVNAREDSLSDEDDGPMPNKNYLCVRVSDSSGLDELTDSADEGDSNANRVQEDSSNIPARQNDYVSPESDSPVPLESSADEEED